MADPVLHIKDGYYFEVPKFMWRHHHRDLDDVPAFLRKAHPEIREVDVFNRALDGKILILPQPFATLKNLHDKESGFAISKFMILELFAAVIVAWIFIRLGRHVADGRPAGGRFWNLFEGMVVFVRDQVARPAIGHHDADRFAPLLWTMFFFILTCNLLGMIPWVGAPTGAFGVTFGLACVTFATTVGSGMLKFNPVGFFLNLVPHDLLPHFSRETLRNPLAIIKVALQVVLAVFILAIELLGLCIKHAILSVRLLANMVAGHLVLLGIMGLIAAAAGASMGMWSLTTGISVLGSTAFSGLELFVAILQAYIFTFLSALFIGAAQHQH